MLTREYLEAKERAIEILNAMMGVPEGLQLSNADELIDCIVKAVTEKIKMDANK